MFGIDATILCGGDGAGGGDDEASVGEMLDVGAVIFDIDAAVHDDGDVAVAAVVEQHAIVADDVAVGFDINAGVGACRGQYAHHSGAAMKGFDAMIAVCLFDGAEGMDGEACGVAPCAGEDARVVDCFDVSLDADGGIACAVMVDPDAFVGFGEDIADDG